MKQSFKDSLELHLKYAFRVNFVLIALYVSYDFVRANITGITDPVAVQVGIWTGSFLHVYLFYYLFPRFLLRNMYKIARPKFNK